MKDITDLPAFARVNKVVRANLLTASNGAPEEIVAEIDKSEVKEDISDYMDANLITSEILPDLHIPVLDIDLNAALVPSTTSGHFHLYLDHTMSWQSYVKLLDALQEAGIVQEGFVAGAKRRGWSSVRLPHIDKYKEEDNVVNPKVYKKKLEAHQKEMAIVSLNNMLSHLNNNVKMDAESFAEVIEGMINACNSQGDVLE